MHKAKPAPAGQKTLILHPTNLWLTIHESVGHPTELDRALGYEANFAGTSFLTTDKLGKFQFGSKLVNIVGDKTQENAMATCGYDDDGVKTTRFPIINEGMFVDYQTTREQAHLIGQKASHGCSYADNWSSIPFQRMPNVSLQPAEKEVTEQDIISATDDGIFIKGDSSYSIDHQRYNFQFSGQPSGRSKTGRSRRSCATWPISRTRRTSGSRATCSVGNDLSARRRLQRWQGPARAEQLGQSWLPGRAFLEGEHPEYESINRRRRKGEQIMIWTREQAKTLPDRALSFSKAEETAVILTGGDHANVRFARNRVTTSGAPPATAWR